MLYSGAPKKSTIKGKGKTKAEAFFLFYSVDRLTVWSTLDSTLPAAKDFMGMRLIYHS